MGIPYNPISTAPTDGTPILTDAGVVKSCRDYWVFCDPSGEEYWCTDQGHFPAYPKAWIPLPTWKLE